MTVVSTDIDWLL